MSHPSLPALNQFIKNSNHLPLSFDPPSCNSDPSAVYSSPAIQLDFEPVHLVKFCLLLIVSLFIPLLSLHSASLPVLGYRRSNSHRGSYRHRTSRCKLPVNYEPPQSIVDAPFIPLPTRYHFRVSHVGNRKVRAPTKVLYTNHSSSDSEDDQSEDGHRSDREPSQRFRLIFGKRLRGEEEEFKGRSAMKGSRLSASSFHSCSLLAKTDSTQSNSTPFASDASQAGLPTPSKSRAVSTKVISFAPVHIGFRPK